MLATVIGEGYLQQRAWRALFDCWRGSRYALHLVIVYVVAMVLSPVIAGWLYRGILPIFGVSITGSDLQFYFSHLLVLNAALGICIGCVTSRIRHSLAVWVWVVPTLLLAVKLATFSAESILVSRWENALAFYFGSTWHVPGSIDEAFRTNLIGMRVYIAQTKFSAPFYSGIGYSTGALLGRMLRSKDLREVIRTTDECSQGKIRKWE